MGTPTVLCACVCAVMGGLFGVFVWSAYVRVCCECCTRALCGVCSLCYKCVVQAVRVYFCKCVVCVMLVV